jgi:hypothetical protein
MFRNTLRALTLSIATLGATIAGVIATPTTVHADPVGGTEDRIFVVDAQSVDVLTVTLRGGEVTRIGLIGDGDTCLELRVFDENGNIVASDTIGMGDRRRTTVLPKWTGKFRLKVRNLGDVSNRYRIILD